MRRTPLVALMATLFVLALLLGCVPSLFPIYSVEDLVFEPALLGTWSERGEDETWTFSAHDPLSYRLAYKDENGREAIFVAHLVAISGRRFLDVFPRELDENTNDFYAFHFLRTHSFYLIEQVEPHVRISYMEPEWLARHVEEHPTVIQHERIDDQIVLTAATGVLQEFFVKHVETPGAYAEPTDLFRVQD
jgi:hypothetical protein